MKHYICVLALALGANAFSQELEVHRVDGNPTSIPISGIDKLSFDLSAAASEDGAVMKIQLSGGGEERIPLAEILKLLFGTGPVTRTHPIRNPDVNTGGFYSNLFSGFHQARLEFELKEPARVALVVHDIQGRKIRSIGERYLLAGTHVMQWDLRDNQQRVAETGPYVLSVLVGGRALSRHMALIK